MIYQKAYIIKFMEAKQFYYENAKETVKFAKNIGWKPVWSINDDEIIAKYVEESALQYIENSGYKIILNDCSFPF